MSAVSLWALESLAYHEGVPGHHMQIAIQNELTDIPAVPHAVRLFGFC
jgi:uncharacterized protein (DUF885 family)